MTSRRHITTTVALLLATTAAATDLAAQRPERIPPFRRDPYTHNNDERLMAKAGYVAYAPFAFGQKGNEPTTTEEIDAHFEDELEIRWVETPHFRLGLELPEWAIPLDPRIRNRVRAELEELKERTGWKRVNPRTRVLKPWLRVHLMAQRLENHYQRFLELVGKTEADFPTERGKWDGQGDYMGEGPYLGQPDKYTILVFEKERSYEDYLLAFTGRRAVGGQRWNYKEVGAMSFFTATEVEDGRLKDDTALYCNLVFNSTHMFVDGYRFYAYDLPVWIREGLAHHFERQVDPNFNSYTRSEGTASITRNASKWRVRTRKLVTNGDFTQFVDAYQWRDFGQIEFDDHFAVWSRWDWLMTMGDEKFAGFMNAIKGRVAKDERTSGADLVEAVRNALQDHYGISPLVMDERWKAWVLENYPTQ